VSGQRDLERLRADAGERARAEAEHRAEADTAPPSAVPPGEPEPPLDLPTWNAQGQLELTGALASASSWRAGARDATRILGTAGGWDLVVIWEREQRVARFACASMWCADPSTRARFETATWQSQQAALGTAVGRAAVASSPCWHVDLEAAEDPHLRAAAAEGMRSALLVPLRHGQEVIGVLELCSRVEHASGEEVTTAAAAVGVQLAHLERMLRLGSAPRWTVGRM
jgi:GAF domain-containing protein